MPSYLQYKRHLALLDADDSNIEAWITVKGNHIPIMKGQSKEEAVKSFIEKKGDKELSKRENKPTTVGNAIKKVVSQVKENHEIYKEHKKQENAKRWDKLSSERTNKPVTAGEATKKAVEIAGKVSGKGNEPKMRIALPEGKERKQIIDRVLNDFHKNYDKLYKNDKLDAQGGDLVKKFDKDMQESPEFKEFVREVVKQRGDVFSSDREVKALMMAAKEYGLIVDDRKQAKTEKEHKDLDDMLQSVMAYGGHKMSPEDILSSGYHGKYLEEYIKKYGENTVKKAIKTMQSKIDHIDYGVATGSEGESYNSIVWKESKQSEKKPIKK